MTNMIPQAPYNNENTWNNMEAYLRQQISATTEAYIIMGSYGTGGTGNAGLKNTITTNGININVPAHVWKVAVIMTSGNGDISRVDAATRVIAVDVPNNNSVTSDWKQYVTTVRAIEAQTGLNLLSALPQSVQDAIEVKTATGL